jgi:hypothetical protein
MSYVADSELAMRCPYCFIGLDFRPMIAYRDGRFVCRDCGHTVLAGISGYKCLCRDCTRVVRARRLAKVDETKHGKS